eukprot:UC4_evm1s1445
MGITCEVRRLHLGDFLWVARSKNSNSSEAGKAEFVLDYVIERKRMDDFVSSVLDGRYSGQKFRFKKAKIKQPIYVVEDFQNMDNYVIEGSAIRQMLVNTQVNDGFHIKRTASLNSTIAYLILMSRHIRDMFAASNILSVRETFAKQMLQIRGVSPKWAAKLVSTFPTARRLLDKLESIGRDAGIKFLQDLQLDGRSNRFGPEKARRV